MPRKATKTAPEAAKPADQGVDSPFAQWAQETPENEPPKKKIGRPSKYTPEIAQKMCEMLAEGIPLREICRQDGFPEWRTVYDWMYRDDAAGDRGVGLSAAIARAREIGYEALAEQCLLIADNPQFGQKQVMTDQGTATTVEDMLGHRKLQIETRLKLLAKWNPKKYGDKITHAGDPEAPLQVNNDAMALLTAAVQNLELKRKA